MTEGDLKLLFAIETAILANTSMAENIMAVVTRTLRTAADKARKSQSDWEAIALQAVHLRVLKSNKAAMAKQIERNKDTACFKWDDVIESLKGTAHD